MNAKKHTVTAPLLCDLSAELEGRYFSRLCIGANRDVLALSTGPEHIGPNFRLKERASFRIHHWRGGQIKTIELPPLDATFYIATPLKENYLCIAASRAHEKRNIHLFDSEGRLLHLCNAGHSIKDVQVSSDDEIWVSYGDEGVFTMTESPSQQGLTCFDERGNRTFGFRDDIAKNPANDLDIISDCYALNVASNRNTWLCYYGGFPLVHLRDLQVEAVFQPPPEMIGSHSFAVCDTRRLFTGGYHFKNRIFWRDEASGRQVELEVEDEDGDVVIWNRACGRGAYLFLCDGARVRTLSLDEIGL